VKHLSLQPLEGVSGRELTAFTQKTIKEILEEEAKALAKSERKEEAEAAKALAEAIEAKEPAPVQTPEPVHPSTPPNAAPLLRQPPQFDRDMAEPESRFPTDPEPIAAEPAKPAKPKGFLRRLIGG